MAKHFWAADDGSVIDFTPSGEGWRKVSANEAKAIKRDAARAKLRALITPGQAVYTVLKHVSSSGMSRRIAILVRDGDNVRNISGYVADACGYKWTDDGAVSVGGCGMDMGFAIVYALGAALWPDGTPEPHGTRNGTPDSDGGYALKHIWL